MQKVGRTIRVANALSIDVAAGAIASSFLFADFYKTTVPANAAIALVLTVWIIYSADHLLDARRIKTAALTFRHSFYQKNFTLLFQITALLAVTNLFFVVSLPDEIILRGLVLGMVVVFYFVVAMFFPSVKEVFAAMMYTAGILVPLASLQCVNVLGMLLIIQFFATALLNLIMFSWFDEAEDIEQGTTSLVTVSGRSFGSVLIWLLFLMNTAALITSSFLFHFVIVWLIAFGHILIFANTKKTEKRERDRYIADALFLMPAFVLL